MQRLILILAMLFPPLMSESQHRGFVFIDQDIGTHQMGYYALEADDGCFFIASEASDYLTFEPGMLLKVSPSGELLQKTTITAGYSHISGLFDGSKVNHNDSSYYAIGKRRSDEGYGIPFILRFDSELNIISLIDVELPDIYEDWCMEAPQVMLDDGGVVFFRSPVGQARAIHLRFTLDGVLLDHKVVLRSGMAGSLFRFPDGGRGLYVSGKLSRITDSLTLEPIVIFNRIMHEPYLGDTINWHNAFVSGGDLYPTATILPDSTLLIAEIVWEEWSNIFGQTFDFDEQMAFFKSDLNGDVEKTWVIGSLDTTERCAHSRAIDYQTSDSVFLCAYQEKQPNSNGNYVLGNKIYVKLTDNGLNPRWERAFMLGSNFYEPFYLLATSDGGCLITGRVYYDNMQMQNVDLFVFKVNADGTVGLEEIEEEAVRPYVYYPNPARDELHLHYSPDVQPKQIELYDLQGRLVRSQSAGLECLNMEGLAAGTYTMRVSLEGGKVFSDKVVKE